MKYIFILIVLVLCSCEQITGGVDPFSVIPKDNTEEKEIIQKKEAEKKKETPIPIANHFDFPVGKPNGKGYYNANQFQDDNGHLGDDWNALTGGNSDLGDPIYTIANGKVIYADDNGPGWGNVIRIIHQLPDETFVESLYAHCDTILVKNHQLIERGSKIGTIGTANGAYLAHLHFEMRDDLKLPIGGGYSNNANGYLNPTEFIEEHR